MKREGRRSHQVSEGFTFVELLPSIVVIGLALLGMLAANTYIQRTSDLAHEQMVAMLHAHRVIERMREASSTGAFPSNVTSAFPNGIALSDFTSVAGEQVLTGEQVVVTYADSNSDPLDITVRTDWQALGARSATVQLRTLMTQRK